MAIAPEDIAEIRARTDLVALISERVALRRVGQRWSGLCPFHQERSPSFSVNGEMGFYKCFGCGVSGDAITFVRELDHLDFNDAVRFLAARAGVTITEDPAHAGQAKRRAELYAAVDAAVEWYHQRLLTGADSSRARAYLRGRGYDGDVVRQFKLGWAPDGWDELAKAITVPAKIFEEAGLGFTNRSGRLQDAFRARVVFPIYDVSNRAIAIGARILPPAPGEVPDPQRGPEPKYKNSTGTPIYDKSKTLYALNWAKADVIRSNEVVVCEGYTDVIGCFVVGVPRAVATCGTALTGDHFKVLANFAKRIVLAYDADSAGQNAIQRVYEWERTHDVEVVVAAMPAGADPGQLAREDPDVLRAAIAEARPFLQFRVDRQFLGADLSSPERRVRVADRALAVVAEHPSDLTRDQYVMAVADRCNLDPAGLRQRLEVLRADPDERALLLKDRSQTSVQPQPERQPTPPRRPRADPSLRPALEALKLAVHRPELVGLRLDASLFVDPVHRAAFEALLDAESLDEAVDHADVLVADLLRQLIVEEPDVEVTALGDPAQAIVVQLVRSATRRALEEMMAKVRVTPANLASYHETMADVKRLQMELDDPSEADAAVATLVAWLAERDRAR